VTDALPNMKQCPNKCTRVSVIDLLADEIKKDTLQPQTIEGE
jgi:hypothetical protein